MADVQYLFNRKKYGRPQAMLWANNPGVIMFDDSIETSNGSLADPGTGGFYVPLGTEKHSGVEPDEDGYEFMILSDDNRDKLDFKTDRIENRQRMINGRMRSYHVADKLKISTSWNMLPSRSFSVAPLFNSLGTPSNTVVDSSYNELLPDQDPVKKPHDYKRIDANQYTTDGGAGGAELLDWYDSYVDSFWVFLAYDKYTNFGTDTASRSSHNLKKFNQVVEMYISSFDYSVERRSNGFDFWNVSIELEEV